MMEAKREFMGRILTDPALAISRLSPTQLIIEYANALADEAGELKREIPFKTWKRDYGHPLTEEERCAAIQEWIDCGVIWVSLGLLLGMDNEDAVEALFIAKEGINIRRQEEGY